jgi:hypothetical protein
MDAENIQLKMLIGNVLVVLVNFLESFDDLIWITGREVLEHRAIQGAQIFLHLRLGVVVAVDSMYNFLNSKENKMASML